MTSMREQIYHITRYNHRKRALDIYTASVSSSAWEQSVNNESAVTSTHSDPMRGLIFLPLLDIINSCLIVQV